MNDHHETATSIVCPDCGLVVAPACTHPIVAPIDDDFAVFECVDCEWELSTSETRGRTIAHRVIRTEDDEVSA